MVYIPKKIDLTGMRFGRLVVIKEDGNIHYGKQRLIAWQCVCDCGNVVTVPGSRLRNGTTASCGCLNRELASNRHKSNLIGMRFGRLKVVEELSSKNNKAMWRCVCDCGNTTTANSYNLTSGKTRSCGCLRKDLLSERSITHQQSSTRLYKIWIGMRERCHNPNHVSYKFYGERGIRVGSEWDDFLTFRDWALNHGYDADAPRGECTLDRIDVNGDYSPANCRWISMAEQNKNRRI